MKKFLLAAVGLAHLSQAGIILPEICMDTMKQANFDKDVEEDESKLKGDLNSVAMMNLFDVAFMRPAFVDICADDDAINGIRFTMKTYRPNWEKLTTEEQKKLDVLNRLQEVVEQEITLYEDLDKKFPGNWLGNQKQPCYQLDIAEQDKIMKVITESDGENLRQITFELTNGTSKVYGSNDTESWDRIDKAIFDFSGHIDPIGIFGMVETENGKAGDIQSFAFLVNTCPIRSMFDFEQHFEFRQTMFEELKEIVSFNNPEADAAVAVVIVIICLSISICLGCYYCIKNRGSICKKKQPGGAAHPVSNDSQLGNSGIQLDEQVEHARE